MKHKYTLLHRKIILTWNFYILISRFINNSGTDYKIKIIDFINSFIDTVAGSTYSIIQTISGSITEIAKVLIGISELNKHEYAYDFQTLINCTN
jgi:hypothetical protein